MIGDVHLLEEVLLRLVRARLLATPTLFGSMRRPLSWDAARFAPGLR